MTQLFPGALTSDTAIERIAERVASYLRAHPNAADGIDGVVWWIPEFSIEPRSHIQDALDLLVARGEIVRKTHADGTVIYGGASLA